MLDMLIKGGLGLYGMAQGNKQINNVANNMPDQGDLEKPYEKSQGLIDRMTNFSQYQGPAMDLSSMQGNKGVEDAMMMGMGGSQANAIRNRMKRSSLTGVYDKFNQGLGTALNAQMGINKDVSGQMFQNAQDTRNIKFGQGSSMMNMASNFMGGAQGMAGMGTAAGTFGKTAFDWGKKGLGGLLGLGSK
jgi:hypothetical protein|tara:strand:- start:44 stop:610 length:567 start_codon:yes stop_codon:yes gene_type:complete